MLFTLLLIVLLLFLSYHHPTTTPCMHTPSNSLSTISDLGFHNKHKFIDTFSPHPSTVRFLCRIKINLLMYTLKIPWLRYKSAAR